MKGKFFSAAAAEERSLWDAGPSPRQRIDEGLCSSACSSEMCQQNGIHLMLTSLLNRPRVAPVTCPYRHVDTSVEDDWARTDVDKVHKVRLLLQQKEGGEVLPCLVSMVVQWLELSPPSGRTLCG